MTTVPKSTIAIGAPVVESAAANQLKVFHGASQNSQNTYAGIGSALGCVALIAVVVVSAVMVRRRKYIR